MGYFNWLWSRMDGEEQSKLIFGIYFIILIGSLFINLWLAGALVLIPVTLLIGTCIRNSFLDYKEYKISQADKIVDKLSGKP